MNFISYLPAIAVVWVILGLVYIVAYNWAKWLFQRRQR